MGVCSSCPCCRQRTDSVDAMLDGKGGQHGVNSNGSYDRVPTNERGGSSYVPPMSTPGGAGGEGYDDGSDGGRLSLPVVSAQNEMAVRNADAQVSQHLEKEGWLRKRGRGVRKNWKRRYFVMRHGVLEYFSQNPATLKKLPAGGGIDTLRKGLLPLIGATVHEVDAEDGKPLIKITSVAEKRNTLWLESAQVQEHNEWVEALWQEIRACNVDSLARGERLPEVEDWYRDQHEGYTRSVRVLARGEDFLLHYVDKHSFIHIIPCSVRVNAEETGLDIRVSDDISPEALLAFMGKKKSKSRHSPGAAQARKTPAGVSRRGTVANTLVDQLNGKTILFQEIDNVLVGAEGDHEAQGKNSADSVCFTIVTEVNESYVLEAGTEAKRDDWMRALSKVLFFIIIPPPATRGGGSV